YQLNRPGAPDVDVSALEKIQAGSGTGTTAGLATGTAADGFAFPKPKHMQNAAGGATTGATTTPARPGLSSGTTTRPATTNTGSAGTAARPGTTGATGSTY